ncbi:MAG TPA: gliding motility-associated C-terminal domain-containing protein, partial [Flavobacteriales bacterium]|nr:gliding motility-associated C-terminal domain-containing protein [Flavobacteriales bacterium]
LYEGVNAHFLFPADSSGIKYYYELQPGANPSVICEKWIGQKSISVVPSGELIIDSEFGKFTLGTPLTYLQKNKKNIPNFYILKGDVVTYELEASPNEIIIIDPWVITPSFSVGDKAFDVDYDKAGNTYVYGGLFPFELLKYDVTGALVWSYTTTVFIEAPMMGGFPNYGDFAVDHNSGSIYLVNGFSNGSVPDAIKLSPSGILLADHYGGPVMNEMWRIVFSSCTNQAIIGGGGILDVHQMCTLDTNLITSTPVNAAGATGSRVDIALLAADNYGYCYYLHSNPGPMPNKLVKCPIPGFLPVVYAVPTSFDFVEVTSIAYISEGGNGFNGLAVSNKSVYAYDGYDLLKFDGVSGTLLNTKSIETFGASSIKFKYWGGLSTDDCQNVFLGKPTVVMQFDSLLNETGMYTMPDTIYDLRISPSGMLYVTGKNFVKTFIPSGLGDCSNIKANLNTTYATCLGGGTASVNPAGGQPPYTVTWNTVPATTGLSISELSAGNYSVTISDSSCSGNETTTAFTIIEASQAQAIIPNIFTPNGDGYNETFYARSFVQVTASDTVFDLFLSYHVEIYNRWGQLMFKGDNPDLGWNGNDQNGQPAVPGVYFVLLKYTMRCNSSKEGVFYQGTVQLVR